MGAYAYCTKPSHVAVAIVEINDVQSETEVALYRYAYKPYAWDRALNARMHFRSGAQACDAAYDRSNKAVPDYGVFFDAEEGTVYAAGRRDANGVFRTGRHSTIIDDSTTTVGRVVRWVKLPKGLTEGPLPKPVPTTYL